MKFYMNAPPQTQSMMATASLCIVYKCSGERLLTHWRLFLSFEVPSRKPWTSSEETFVFLVRHFLSLTQPVFSPVFMSWELMEVKQISCVKLRKVSPSVTLGKNIFSPEKKQQWVSHICFFSILIFFPLGFPTLKYKNVFLRFFLSDWQIFFLSPEKWWKNKFHMSTFLLLQKTPIIFTEFHTYKYFFSWIFGIFTQFYTWNKIASLSFTRE